MCPLFVRISHFAKNQCKRLSPKIFSAKDLVQTVQYKKQLVQTILYEKVLVQIQQLSNLSVHLNYTEKGDQYKWVILKRASQNELCLKICTKGRKKGLVQMTMIIKVEVQKCQSKRSSAIRHRNCISPKVSSARDLVQNKGVQKSQSKWCTIKKMKLVQKTQDNCLSAKESENELVQLT